MAGVHAVRCLQCRLGGAKTGVEEDVGPGDVMVIPAGVAHERYAAPFSATLYNRHKVTGKILSWLLARHITRFSQPSSHLHSGCSRCLL